LAKTRVLPSQTPSLPPEKAVPIFEGLLEDAKRIGREGRLSPTRQEWIHTAEGALRAAFGDSDANVQAFGTAQCGAYSPGDTEEYLEGQAQTQLSDMVSVLQSAVKQLRWRLSDPQQVFLPAGSQHDAYVEIRKIIQDAKTEILIVDPYVDHTLWSLLTNVSQSCKVRVLTEHLKGDLILEGKKFCAQYKNAVQVRVTSSYHDRFVVLDGARCFHLGASIKDAGNRACAISEIRRPQLAGAIIADAESEWLRATTIPL
jgi:hypothetical protein